MKKNETHENYYEVRWKNFKGFNDTGWIKIKPITILLGANNAGKTNFIAPLLLMQQTLTSRDARSTLIVKSGLYDGGSIQELLNDYDLTKELFFGIRYHIHQIPKGKKPLLGTRAPGALEVTLGVNNHKIDGDIYIKKESVSDVFNRVFYSLEFNKDTKDYKISGDIESSKMTDREKKAINNSNPLNFIFTTDSILSKLTEKDADKKRTKRKKGYSSAFSNMLQVMSDNYGSVRSYIGNLSYIGPLREYPHRVYEISNESYETVGVKGENMANLIKRHFPKRHKQLDSWINRFGFGDWLNLKHLYGNSYSIRFIEKNKPGFYTSIANSGFGASQIMPLIIQALVAGEGSLTIAEQPEIHLNPKLQCELADLFVFMASREQKVIIETHSEYLLLRLRTLVAENKISADDIALYFVTKEDDESKIREIKIQKDGHIKREDWPSNFFEDTLRESLALATQQSKLKKP